MKALFILLVPFLMMFIGCGDSPADLVTETEKSADSGQLSDQTLAESDVDRNITAEEPLKDLVNKSASDDNFYIYNALGGTQGDLAISFYRPSLNSTDELVDLQSFSRLSKGRCASVPSNKIDQVVGIMFSSVLYPNQIICRTPMTVSEIMEGVKTRTPSCQSQNYIVRTGEPSGWWFIGEGGKYSVEVVQELTEEEKTSCTPLFN